MITWINALAFFVGLMGSYLADLWIKGGGSHYVGVVIFIVLPALIVLALAAVDFDA